MRVTDLQAYLLSSPLPEHLEVDTAAGRLLIYKQDCLLLRIHTDQGLRGYAAGPPSANLAQLINRNLKAAVVNTDPVRLDGLRKKIFQRRPLFPGLAQAFGLVEVALLDLLGKAEGCPVSELLGGCSRPGIPLIASAGFYLAGQEAAEEGGTLVGGGFGAYRLRMGLGPEADAETVSAVRTKLPEECQLILDSQAWWQMGHQAYPPERFDEWLQQIARFTGIRLLEPFPARCNGAYRKLTERKLIPVAAGEHEDDPQKLLLLAREQGVEWLQINTTLVGGLMTAKEALSAAAQVGCYSVLSGAITPLEVLTAAHLGSCFQPSVCAAVEWPCYATNERVGTYPFPLGDELLKQPLSIENGELMIPERPGLGVAVNESVIERYPWKSGPSRVLK
jgi:L-alanine-DL-glutamate epimerase-like enolase superfamily enzyme